MKRVFVFLLIPFLASCFGRPHAQNQSFPLAALGLQQGKAAVIAFSALWCHPCREEIQSLNEGEQEFGGQIQFLGFLVEGEEKGSPVTIQDLANFQSFTGEKPTYPVRLDTGWQLFDSRRTPEGRALPTMLIVDQYGQTVEIVQESLDYASQLRPILQALARGQSAPPVVTPPPSPSALTDSVEHWLARPEVSANPAFVQNLTDAWQSGLITYTIDATDMPLNDGQISFSWDGTSKDVPLSVTWHETTPTSICKMTLILKPDATLKSSTGSCRPR